MSCPALLPNPCLHRTVPSAQKAHGSASSAHGSTKSSTIGPVSSGLVGVRRSGRYASANVCFRGGHLTDAPRAPHPSHCRVIHHLFTIPFWHSAIRRFRCRADTLYAWEKNNIRTGQNLEAAAVTYPTQVSGPPHAIKPRMLSLFLGACCRRYRSSASIAQRQHRPAPSLLCPEQGRKRTPSEEISGLLTSGPAR